MRLLAVGETDVQCRVKPSLSSLYSARVARVADSIRATLATALRAAMKEMASIRSRFPYLL